MGAALGGALSAILCVLILVVARATTHIDAIDVVGVIVALGTLVAIVLGWRFGPRVTASGGFGLIAWMGTSAMLLGVLEVVLLVVANSPSTGLGVLLLAFYAVAYGLAFGLIVLPFTIACAACWFGVMLMIGRLARIGHARSPGMTGASGARVVCV
jgi:hypothetical protein